MNIPLSWLKDFIDIDLPLEELARVMTMAGLEVDEVELRGLMGPENDHHGFKFTGLSFADTPV
jgi:phenylalanyl-tRNA synthetase beta chain